MTFLRRAQILDALDLAAADGTVEHVTTTEALDESSGGAGKRGDVRTRLGRAAPSRGERSRSDRRAGFPPR
jgi:hypothetical protein